MRTLRIVVFGLLAATAALTIATIHVWREGARRKEALRVLRELTPERLIASCGQPSSDIEPIVLNIKAGTATVSSAGADSVGEGIPIGIGRSMEYKRRGEPYWVKFDFARDVDKQLRPTPWRLTHFASPSVGVKSVGRKRVHRPTSISLLGQKLSILFPLNPA